MPPVDSGSLSQRMQRVVGDAAGHGSIERLLRLAARLCGGSYAAVNDDDYAIGCECANPALQIESWAREPVAQPFQRGF